MLILSISIYGTMHSVEHIVILKETLTRVNMFIHLFLYHFGSLIFFSMWNWICLHRNQKLFWFLRSLIKQLAGKLYNFLDLSLPTECFATQQTGSGPNTAPSGGPNIMVGKGSTSVVFSCPKQKKTGSAFSIVYWRGKAFTCLAALHCYHLCPEYTCKAMTCCVASRK